MFALYSVLVSLLIEFEDEDVNNMDEVEGESADEDENEDEVGKVEDEVDYKMRWRQKWGWR